VESRRRKPHRLPPSSYVGQIAISFTACVEYRRRVFHNPSDIEPFIKMMQDQFARFECLAPIYCFMPDHLHVITMGMTHRAGGKRAMDAFKYFSGNYLYSKGNPFCWQDDFHDRIIRRSEEWRNKVFYIFQNPVLARLVEDPWTYPLTGTIG